jgi:gamma-glutamyltranspeptidase/glutathione hydrolase
MPPRRGALLLLALLVAVPSSWICAAHPPAVAGSGGAVASSEASATEVGLEVLRRGGNAVDAAVACALALAVVYPPAGNLGGGGFAVIRSGGEIAALDFRETAPAGASREMYLGRDGRPVADRSLVGPLAAGVPGTPGGLHEMHLRYGRLPWRQVVDPAIRLAEDGFAASERLSREIAGSSELLARFPETAAVWLPDGTPPAPGATVRLPTLAATLRAYAELGPPAITEGPAAAAIQTIVHRYGGILTAEDLAAYRPVWRQALIFEAFGWQVAAMPLPSSGGIILGQSCGMLERLGWPSAPRFGADRIHLLAEVWRRAYADRFLLGDPRSVAVDPARLLSPQWLDLRAGAIDRTRATPSSRVRPWSEEAFLEPAATTHLSVLDGEGGSVSLTTTLNGRFGCGLLIPGVGILLNNEMDDFTTAPGVPNDYGLIQGEANSVGPGKRMLSSMAPTIAWRGNEILVIGGRGGSMIPTATLQVLLSLIVDGDPLQAAVDRPRVHHQWLPDAIVAEDDALSPETARELKARGHTIREVADPDQLPKVNAVRRRDDGVLEGAGDPRGPAVAGVVTPAPGSVHAAH